MLYKPKAYSHPVLSYLNSNYEGSQLFDCEFDLVVDEESSELCIKFSFIIENNPLVELLVDKGANLGFDLYCSDTISRQFFVVEDLTGELRISDLDIIGSLEVAPVMAAAKDIKEFRPHGISSEYGIKEFHVKAGSPLAIAPIKTFEIAPDHKSAPKLFKFASRDNKPPHYYELITDGPTLHMLVSPEIFQAINVMKSDKNLWPMMFPSLIQDAIESAIETIQVDDPETAWAKALVEKIRREGIVFSRESDPRMVAAELVYGRGWRRVLAEKGEG